MRTEAETVTLALQETLIRDAIDKSFRRDSRWPKSKLYFLIPFHKQEDEGATRHDIRVAYPTAAFLHEFRRGFGVFADDPRATERLPSLGGVVDDRLCWLAWRHCGRSESAVVGGTNRGGLHISVGYVARYTDLCGAVNVGRIRLAGKHFGNGSYITGLTKDIPQPQPSAPLLSPVPRDWRWKC
jgi:hypothetical protein